MGELAEVYQFDDFTEFDDGDGGGIDKMPCPDCESTDWGLIGLSDLDDDIAEFHITCNGCGLFLAGVFPQVMGGGNE